ncbi:unknown [Neodiprion lecontei nucleopolyhedrovirus]|uniref:Uncharacterized protein n=1 Tax=Neodiprion lecontei nucleopolyhedrovirus (strain Canada) TaxID=654906 RepID=Q6JP93_NPVNC|nr:unknown [Neodiprion lecontei nucleopolyhedrovirus]AAQ99091.1 unknown [Neodiprion lecontei nucleopolyhedrovirus]
MWNLEEVCKNNESWHLIRLIFEYVDPLTKWNIFSHKPTHFDWQQILCPYNKLVVHNFTTYERLLKILSTRVHANLYCAPDEKTTLLEMLSKLTCVNTLHLHVEAMSTLFTNYFYEQNTFVNLQYLVIGACANQFFKIANKNKKLNAFGIEYYVRTIDPLSQHNITYFYEIFTFIKTLGDTVYLTRLLCENNKYLTRFWFHNKNIVFNAKLYKTFKCKTIKSLYFAILMLVNTKMTQNNNIDKFQINESKIMYNNYVKIVMCGNKR